MDCLKIVHLDLQYCSFPNSWLATDNSVLICACLAEALGYRDPKVFAFVQETLWFLSHPDSNSVPAVLERALKVGECNFRVMQLLSEAHSDTFGHPTPTSVTVGPQPGKAILVS